jgi:hypothetical protein
VPVHGWFARHRNVKVLLAFFVVLASIATLVVVRHRYQSRRNATTAVIESTSVTTGVNTNLYRLELREHDIGVREFHLAISGPFALRSDSLAWVSGTNGQLYEVEATSGHFDDPEPGIISRPVFRLRDGPRPIAGFGVKDIMQFDDSTLIFTSAEYVRIRHCVYLTVGRLHLRTGVRQTLFKSNCEGGRGEMGEGIAAGGAIARRDSSNLLVSVGDFYYHASRAQSPQHTFGRLMLIRVDGSSSRVFSIGHRNPQGILVESGGRVLETEHGPEGGDELNEIVEGGNYGWPLVSLGHPYTAALHRPAHSFDATDFAHRWAEDSATRAEWPESEWARTAPSMRSGRFIEPIFAYAPSIGIGRIVRYRCDASAGADVLGYWCGDLLIAALATTALHRIVLTSGASPRVILDEAIPIGRRIRGIAQMHSGSIILKTDQSTFVVLRHR